MDELYIKMILALPDEIFTDWELKDGDQVYLLKDIDGYTCSEKYGLYTVEEWNYVTCMVKGGIVRPIPSQEQLQKISKLDWDLYYHGLVKNYSNYDTAEQAGLAMIMYAKCGKSWDGESWI